MAKPKHTIKQQRFIDFYDGNATDAARKAGYKNPKSQGQRLLTFVDIARAVQKRENKRNGKHIATRQERQEFWTSAMNFDMRGFYNKNGSLKPYKDLDPELARLVQSIKVTKDGDEIEYKLPDRLKASEHLGRSEADFTDTQKHVGADGKDLIWVVKIGKSEDE